MGFDRAEGILLSRRDALKPTPKSIILTCEMCEDLLSTSQRHAGSSLSMRALTSVHAKLHAALQEVDQDATEERILMCSIP